MVTDSDNISEKDVLLQLIIKALQTVTDIKSMMVILLVVSIRNSNI